MIIAVCTDDKALVKCARDACAHNPEIFGAYYRVLEVMIPPLAEDEDLFLIAHGAYIGDDGNPVIGDKAEPLFLNAVAAFQQLQAVFPAGYSGNVYIYACEASNHARGSFSFAEVFKAQIQAARPRAGNVYGQAGSVGLRVPPPSDGGWKRA